MIFAIIAQPYLKLLHGVVLHLGPTPPHLLVSHEFSLISQKYSVLQAFWTFLKLKLKTILLQVRPTNYDFSCDSLRHITT